ncbi:hypothetical protein ILFOPFJJ_06260 [Ensifer psoraleae]|nr:hypothetical protein [Sinorhizobium psoraleae]
MGLRCASEIARCFLGGVGEHAHLRTKDREP